MAINERGKLSAPSVLQSLSSPHLLVPCRAARDVIVVRAPVTAAAAVGETHGSAVGDLWILIQGPCSAVPELLLDGFHALFIYLETLMLLLAKMNL